MTISFLTFLQQKDSPNFSNQITTFLEKMCQMSLPKSVSDMRFPERDEGGSSSAGWTNGSAKDSVVYDQPGTTSSLHTGVKVHNKGCTGGATTVIFFRKRNYVSFLFLLRQGLCVLGSFCKGRGKQNVSAIGELFRTHGRKKNERGAVRE